MNVKVSDWVRILGWLLFVLAIAFFCLQMGYLYVNKTFQVEYIDDQIFYIVNMICVIFLTCAVLALISLTKTWKVVWTSIAAIFVISNISLLVIHNNEIKNVIDISPNVKHVLSLKTDLGTGETTYYRNYYGILARAKEKLPYQVDGDFNIKWLADDIGAVTYKGTDHNIHQFIATYGDRGDGLSYYNVAPEIQGIWQGEDVEVISDTNGITVSYEGKSELFEFDHVVQFGTIAVVLTRENEAAWTIALNENINIDTGTYIPHTGQISLYEATMGETEPIVLDYQGID